MARKKSSDWVKISGYLFLLGVIIAVIVGILGEGVIPYAGTILAVFGFIIGLLGAAGMGSIGKGETEMFMLAAIALMVVGLAGTVLNEIPVIGMYLAQIVGYIAVLVAPAVVILALEAIWKAGKTRYM